MTKQNIGLDNPFDGSSIYSWTVKINQLLTGVGLDIFEPITTNPADAAAGSVVGAGKLVLKSTGRIIDLTTVVIKQSYGDTELRGHRVTGTRTQSYAELRGHTP